MDFQSYSPIHLMNTQENLDYSIVNQISDFLYYYYLFIFLKA